MIQRLSSMRKIKNPDSIHVFDIKLSDAMFENMLQVLRKEMVAKRKPTINLKHFSAKGASWAIINYQKRFEQIGYSIHGDDDSLRIDKKLAYSPNEDTAFNYRFSGAHAVSDDTLTQLLTANNR
eukprot:277981_1